MQTKSLSTQLSLTTNQRNPGCLVIAGNTGNVVCNTSFTDLSDSRVKTEIAKADVAELLQLFDSVEAKQHGRLRRNEVEEFDGDHAVERRSVLWGVCKSFQARLDALEAWQAQRGPKNK